MTWSYNPPRAVTRAPDDITSPATTWSPDDLSSGRPRPLNRLGAPGSPEPDPAALAELRDEAFARGYAAGLEAGEEAEAQRLRTAVLAAQEALEAAQDGMARWVGHAEENICALAVSVARHILERELALDATLVPQLVQRALAECPIDQPVIVHLHPVDCDLVRSAALDTSARADVQWVPDAAIAPGGCFIEARDRLIDGRVDTALERLYRRLSAVDA